MAQASGASKPSSSARQGSAATSIFHTRCKIKRLLNRQKLGVTPSSQHSSSCLTAWPFLMPSWSHHHPLPAVATAELGCRGTETRTSASTGATERCSVGVQPAVVQFWESLAPKASTATAAQEEPSHCLPLLWAGLALPMPVFSLCLPEVPAIRALTTCCRH